MKKLFSIVAALVLAFGQLNAAPVDVNMAKNLGVNFLNVNVASARNINDAELIYTLNSESGIACLYVFNYGENGYIVVSADDRAKPILAYSEESRFDAQNIPDGMSYYLNHYKTCIEYLIDNNTVATEDIAAEWELVRKQGLVTLNRLNRSVGPLINLSWNQDYPYNYYCPTAPGGPGGRCYVGCVADAMAMVMKYWNYPDQGVGSHTYTPAGYPAQTANFGETTYDWANMPLAISAGSQPVHIQAIATLMWHCGISVDMQYAPDGSGAYSVDVHDAIVDHFKYTQYNEQRMRSIYTKAAWEDMLIANFDQGFPAYYSGNGNVGGHAFICDGYDDNRFFYFNWGWSGMANGFFAIDALNTFNGNFNLDQTAYFDMIPDYAYDDMPSAPSSLSVENENSYSYNGIVSWVNPSQSPNGIQLGTLDKIVLLRNGVEIFTQDNVAPGESMSFVDEVSGYDCFTYEIYAVHEGIKGRYTSVRHQYGPTCTWKIVGTTSNFQGWNGGEIQVLNQNGTIIQNITMTGSSPISVPVAMPEGNVSFNWVAPATAVSTMSITIKNSSNTTVFTYNGSSNNMTNNVFYTDENNCEGCQAPENLSGDYQSINGEFGAMITWENGGEPQSFKVYRSVDNVDYEVIATVNSADHQYFDVSAPGEYFYKVTAYNSYCESMFAMTSDMEQDYINIIITSIEEDNNIQAVLYPNPTTGNLTVKAESMKNIEIYNTIGQRMMNVQVDSDEKVIDMKGLENGLYMIRIISENGSTTKRITLID